MQLEKYYTKLQKRSQKWTLGDNQLFVILSRSFCMQIMLRTLQTLIHVAIHTSEHGCHDASYNMYRDVPA
jgi:hypothetical protein